MKNIKLWWKQSTCNHSYSKYLFSADYSKSDIEKEVMICAKCEKEKDVVWWGFNFKSK